MQIFLLICLYLNCCIDIDKSQHVFKHANIIPVHKKKEKNDKTIYRAVSILPNRSKIYKKSNTIDCMIILIRQLFQVNLDSAKDIVLIIAS